MPLDREILRGGGAINAKFRRAEPQNGLARCCLQRVFGAPQHPIYGGRILTIHLVMKMVMTGDLMTVSGDACDQVRGLIGDHTGAEKRALLTSRTAMGAIEAVDLLIATPKRINPQRAGFPQAEIAFEIMRDVFEINAEKGGHGLRSGLPFLTYALGARFTMAQRRGACYQRAMRLSLATAKDLDAVAALLRARDGAPPARAEILRDYHLEGEGGFLMLVHEGETPVALSAFEQREMADHGGALQPFLYWKHLYVAEPFRDGRAYVLMTGRLRQMLRAGDIAGVYSVVHRQNVLPMHMARGFQAGARWRLALTKVALRLWPGRGTGRSDTRVLAAEALSHADLEQLCASLNRTPAPGTLAAYWTPETLARRLARNRYGSIRVVIGGAGCAIFRERRLAPFLRACFPLTESCAAAWPDFRKALPAGLTLYASFTPAAENQRPGRFSRLYSLISLSPPGAPAASIRYEFLEHDAI